MSGNRRNNTRNYRATRSRSSRRTYEQSSGGGGFLLFLGLILIGAYFYMNEEAFASVKDTVDKTVSRVKVLVEQQIDSDTMVPVSVTPSTQAQIVKILAYTVIEGGDQQVEYEGDFWYSKYYRALQEDERFSFLREENAAQPITYEETLDILKQVAGTGYQVSADVDETTASQSVKISDFIVAYEQAMSYGAIEHQLNYEHLSVLGTLNTNTMLDAWQVGTHKGIYGFEGLILDPFKDYTLNVITIGDEILGIVDAVSSHSTINQCFIQTVEDGKAVVQIGGLTFQYEAPTLSKSDEGTIGRIVVKNSQIIDFDLQLDADTDVVVKIDHDTIEFKEAGTLPFEEVLVYSGIENELFSSLSQLYSGIEVAYTLDNGHVTSLKVVDTTLDDKIRVLVSEDGLGEYVHPDITLVAEVPYTIRYEDEVIHMDADVSWTASTFFFEKFGDKVIIEAEGQEGIYIHSMSKQGVHPMYEGVLEIYREDDGYHLVNELAIESYVAAVIPSEMPTSYGLEAAKVQAVAARSYAMSHREESKYLKYGAQVDDTVATQVYNRVPADAISYQATQETVGEVLVHNGQIISGNFFATSAGHTANFGETWANGEIFPTNTPVYLVSRQQYVGNRLVDDLSDEKDAYSFFTKSPEEVDAFDSESPWFRWEIELTGEELSQMVNANVYRLTTQYPNMVKVKDGYGQWGIDELENIGAVVDIAVTDRGSGGNIMEMIIEGEEETIKVSTEYLIRTLLAPIQLDNGKEAIQIVRADGSVIDNMAMLPSAFFSMDIIYDEENVVDDVIVFGGGFGHGVGMSQDGVKGMSEQGYTYREILRHYYASSEIETFLE